MTRTSNPPPSKVLKLYACLFIALLGACAPTRDELRQSLEISDACCQSLEQFEYIDLAYGQTITTRISEKNRSFAFTSGKSYFLAYRLPAFQAPYTISIHSYLTGMTYTRGYFFYPISALLDDNHRIRSISRIPADRMTDAERQTLMGDPYLVQDISIQEADRFLVVYTDPQMIGQSFPYIKDTVVGNTVYHPYGSVVINRPVHIRANIAYAVGGKLEVRIPALASNHGDAP